VLADVLSATRFSGAMFFTSRLSAPWAISSPPRDQLGRTLHVREECISLFHLITEGRCWIALDGRPPLQVDEGTVIILPRGNAHVLTSSPGLDPAPVAPLLARLPREPIPHVDLGGGGDASRLVCGYLQCEHPFTPLMGALPQMLLVRASGEALATRPGDPALVMGRVMDEDEWVRAMLTRTAREADSERPGSSVMVARLAELLFVAVLRGYIERLPSERAGWLAAVADPEVGRALQLLHSEPARPWTVTSLAREASLSRSALAQRFTALVGESPMHYLASWRMWMARRLLRETRLSPAQIAGRVGYASEIGFHKAFKRVVGMPPVAWRSMAERR
jgi:AraC-like DNA-binding protein